jgi:hypothetical protein
MNDHMNQARCFDLMDRRSESVQHSDDILILTCSDRVFGWLDDPRYPTEIH